jgi:two-component system sensor histidine kinase AlgZ
MPCSVNDRPAPVAVRTLSLPRGSYLPDSCAPPVVLMVVLVAALIALILTLARQGLDQRPSVNIGFWTDLATTSWLLLWIGLGTAAGLCGLRRSRLRTRGVAVESAAALLCVVGVTVVVSALAAHLAASPLAVLTSPATAVSPDLMRGFILRNALLAALCGAVLLRYLYVTHQWRLQVEAESRSRVQALQARIRPHFLFNSLNTIAALTGHDAERAATAVEDLAELFRASLAADRERVSVGEELEIARTYARLERARLGPRLTIDWAVEDLDVHCAMPPLMLQPLLENAVYHGIERLLEGGTITVRAGRDGQRAWMEVDNPLPDAPLALATAPGIPLHRGHQETLANIRERLALLYAGQGALETRVVAQRFSARLLWPAPSPVDPLP